MLVEINNFFSDSFCDQIIKECNVFIDKKKLNSEYNREGNTVILDQHKELQNLDKKIFERINLITLNRLIYIFALNISNIKDSGYSFHRYEKNDKLFTHGDGVFSELNNEKFNLRVLSLIVNLTTNENADLIFPRHNKSIKSEKGKLVAFLPHECYEHYMNNNSGKNRDILVTWLIDSSIECRKVNNGKKIQRLRTKSKT